MHTYINFIPQSIPQTQYAKYSFFPSQVPTLMDLTSNQSCSIPSVIFLMCEDSLSTVCSKLFISIFSIYNCLVLDMEINKYWLYYTGTELFTALEIDIPWVYVLSASQILLVLLLFSNLIWEFDILSTPRRQRIVAYRSIIWLLAYVTL